jgi:hypothetical protein
MTTIDRYTKAVLTVIAAALVTLATQNAIHSSNAQLTNGVQKVAVCNLVGPLQDPRDPECASVRVVGVGPGLTVGVLRVDSSQP